MQSSNQKHKERLWELGIECLTQDLGLEPEQSADIIGALLHQIDLQGYCLVCSYKKKSSTGAASHDDGELDPQFLDSVEEIINNPQRDGDSGDRSIREDNATLVLRRHRNHPEGLTDEELEPDGDFKDTIRAQRVALMNGGWIKALIEDGEQVKRPSRNNRPQQVWVLTTGAKEFLAHNREN